jgi:hypothetical protein
MKYGLSEQQTVLNTGHNSLKNHSEKRLIIAFAIAHGSHANLLLPKLRLVSSRMLTYSTASPLLSGAYPSRSNYSAPTLDMINCMLLLLLLLLQLPLLTLSVSSRRAI